MPREALRRYPLFALLDGAALDAWMAAGQELAFSTGETIFQAGTPGVWVYVVLAGRVRVVRSGEERREVSVACLESGQVFGEYALVPPGQNTATCRAASPCRLWRLPLRELQAVLGMMPAVCRRLKDWMRLNALVSHLRNEPFLGFMSGPSALKWVDRLQEVAFPPSCTLQADGLSEETWYYVTEGRVKLYGTGGATTGSRELQAGGCFGERALIGCGDLAVAEALTETKCLCLTRDAFDDRPRLASGVSVQSLALSRSDTGAPLTWVGQQEEADCGPAALAIMLRYLGVDRNTEPILAQLRLNAQGASLQELERAAKALGLRAQSVRIHPNQCGQVRLPAIAHYRDGHYVVLCEYGSTGVQIADPATGVVRLTRELFHSQASGYFLLLTSGSLPDLAGGAAPGQRIPPSAPAARERDAWLRELLEEHPLRTTHLLESLRDATLQQLAQLKLQGYSNTEIASQVGLSERSVERKLQLIRKVWEQKSADRDSSTG